MEVSIIDREEIKVNPEHSKTSGILRHIFRHENAILFFILIGLVAGMAGITRGLTLSRGNVLNIFLQASARGIAAVGELFVLLTGNIDLSVGGIGLVCAVLGASLMAGTTGFPITAVVIMLLLGLGIGGINGSLVSRVPMPGLMVTFGMWIVTKGGAYLICRGITFHHLPESLAFLGMGKIAGVTVPVIIFIAVAAISYFVLNNTVFGRSVYAAGGNPTSAWLSGINVRNIQFMVYIISGFLAALAGLVLLARTMSGGMNTVVGLELDAIAGVCIGGVSLAGGRGTVTGAVLGILILAIVKNGMNVFALHPAYQDLVKGTIIIIAVAIDNLRRRRG